jgi:hypothetical protein
MNHTGAKQMVDLTDCYFDAVCHPKVNWDEVKVMKEEFFSQLKIMREAGAANSDSGVKFLERMHDGFKEAGVPEDRIDYILTKWVEVGHPQVLDSMLTSAITVSGFGCANGYGRDNNQEYLYKGTSKDGRPVYRGTKNPNRYIYYDSYCADDTREPRWLLGGKPDMDREFNLNTRDGKGCENDFSIVSDSKHVPGGQQRVAWNWCGDHGLHDSETVSITYEIKGKAAAIPRMVERRKADDDEGSECSKYQSWGEAAVKGCHGCTKWYPGRTDECMECGGKCKDICPAGSSPDCYRGEEFVKCHKTCMLMGAKVQEMSVVAGGLGNLAKEKKHVKENQCSKYEKWGSMAIRGCAECARWYPGRTDECMECGGKCKNICPAGSSPDCYRGEEFVKCHKKCMLMGAKVQEVSVVAV